MNLRQDNEEAIFDEARRIADPVERMEFLDRSCNSDAALRERLAELLNLDPQAENFFSGVVQNVSATGWAEVVSGNSPVLDEQIGTVIGRYKLLEKIGEGGCGVVFIWPSSKSRCAAASR